MRQSEMNGYVVLAIVGKILDMSVNSIPLTCSLTRGGHKVNESLEQYCVKRFSMAQQGAGRPSTVAASLRCARR